MKQFLFLICSLLIFTLSGYGQKRVYLWNENEIPNQNLKIIHDSIARQRAYKISKPWIECYFAPREVNKKAAVLIIPGGGYSKLTYEISGRQLAQWFNVMGINAFVLYHRLPYCDNLIKREITPIQDAQRAMRIIRSKASEWEIDPQRIGTMGCSAGGHVASTLGTYQIDESNIKDGLEQYGFNPNFMLLISPVITMTGEYVHKGSKENLLGKNVNEKKVERFSAQLNVDARYTPPTFLVHAYNDKTVKCENSILFFTALRENGIPASLHIFPEGGHSIALRNNPGSTATWTQTAEIWLQEIGILNKL